jgi:hypothetical protein
MFNPKEDNLLDQQLAESGLEMNNFFADLFTGGGYSRNKAAKKAADRQNKYNKEVYEFQYGDVDDDEIGGELKRQYKYEQESLAITKRNTENNLQLQEANLIQRYNYGMGVREYEYNQLMRGYDQSVAQAFQQNEYNQLAEKFALVDQDRLLHEQLIDLAFDQTESLLEYRRAASGLGLKQRQALAGARTEAQAARVSGLKAQGASAARGMSGRSAARDIQGIVAETGARQAAIVDDLMFNQENTAADFVKLNNQFIIDQVALDFSEDSARLTDMSERNKIKARALQELIKTANSIAIKPEIAPPLPKPFALPRPEYAEVYKPKKPPKPMKEVPFQENLFAAAVTKVGSAVAAGVTAGAGVVAAGQSGAGLATQMGIGAGMSRFFS